MKMGLLEHTLNLIGQIDGKRETTFEEATFVLSSFGYELVPDEWANLTRPLYVDSLQSGNFGNAQDFLKKLGIVNARGQFQKEGYEQFVARLSVWNPVFHSTFKPKVSVEELGRLHESNWKINRSQSYEPPEHKTPVFPISRAVDYVPPPVFEKNPLTVFVEPLLFRQGIPSSSVTDALGSWIHWDIAPTTHIQFSDFEGGLGLGARYFFEDSRFFAEGSVGVGHRYATHYYDDYFDFGYRTTSRYTLWGSLTAGYTVYQISQMPMFDQFDLKIKNYAGMEDKMNFWGTPTILLLSENFVHFGPVVVSGYFGQMISSASSVYGFESKIEF
ncbi:MAG: hypothetical protein Q7T03_04420 [Deltaproteobacteria bacterium]|nr:hypothetical protein [Deltaproteobacteria bacterium]